MIKFFTKSATGLVILGFLLFMGSAAFKPATSKLYVSNYENVLGTSLELKISATNGSSAVAEKAALAEIDRLNAILSAYIPTSEFSKWHNGTTNAVKVSKDLFDVLSLFDSWQQASHGALNAGAGTIGKIWKSAEKNQELPTEQTLETTIIAATAPHWKLDYTHKTAQRLDHTDLVLNSFVKSYIINKAADAALSAPGVTGVVVNIGGDIVVKGNTAESVEISDPLADAENDAPLTTVKVAHQAIATSGNYRRGYNINHQWYSHIVDPRNGMPANDIISATVIATDATTAGALATAFNVLTVKESAELATKYPDVSYLIITKDGAAIESANWKGSAIEQSIEKSLAPLTQELAAPKYELLINLELALIEGQRIHRPFVAIWIEDGHHKPVKNIAIWFNKTRWLPDLKSWYRAYGLDFGAEGNPVKSTSSATRSPGKYTVKWDGKDDAGNAVKAGTYRVNIEVAREHGTYQLITQDINWNGKATNITLPGNTEVAAASLEYRKAK